MSFWLVFSVLKLLSHSFCCSGITWSADSCPPSIGLNVNRRPDNMNCVPSESVVIRDCNVVGEDYGFSIV